MVKISDTYNPITGEYVKRISDYVDLTGDLDWEFHANVAKGHRVRYNSVLPSVALNENSGSARVFEYTSKALPFDGSGLGTDCWSATNGYKTMVIAPKPSQSGWAQGYVPTVGEIKAYFFGHKMANSDGTSPYYKSEVPYTPATWAEWTKGINVSSDSTGITLISNGAWGVSTSMNTSFKTSTKYGILLNVLSNTLIKRLIHTNGAFVYETIVDAGVTGNVKTSLTSKSTIASNTLGFQVYNDEPVGNSIKIKDLRIFELPAGSQIEADFTNLSADELSVKYTFNGLCVKHWKKVTDGTGLTSTLPTASYAGYTPYRMIYQLATPEISYLTPKATIPLYDTNTIVETDTPSDCKADVTVGYKLKSGATAVAGDITAPTPDYMSAVNSVSELGDKKGIVRSPNIVTNGNFANGTTGWLFAVNSGASVLNGEIKAVGTEMYSPVYQQIQLYKNNKYYYSVKVKNTSTVMCYCDLSANGMSRINFEGNSSSFIRKSSVFTRVEDALTNLNLLVLPTTGDGLPRYCDDVFLVNLTTTFGAGNEPTKEQCDILFVTWQDKASTQATLPTLRKIGTVADTYNPETGVLVQRIGKKIVTGAENWVDYSVSAGTDVNTIAVALSITDLFFANDSANIAINNMVENGTVSNVYSIDKEVLGTKEGQVRFRIKKDRIGQKNSVGVKAYLAQKYTDGNPLIIYYQLVTPVVTTLTKTALPTYKPTTVIESDSTVKSNVSADYKLMVDATPVAGDFIASPECTNDIKDLGNSVDIVSSAARRNLIKGGIGNSRNGLFYYFNTVTDEYVEHRLVSKRTYSSVNISPGFLIAPRNYRVGEKVRFSYDIMYTEWNFPAGTNRDEFWFGQRYTNSSISSDGAWRGTTQHTLPIVGQGGCVVNEWYRKEVTLTIPTAAHWSVGDAASIQFYNSNSTIEASFSFRLKNVKLEYAETTSQMTPSPEEIPYNTTTNGVYKTNILLSAPLRSVGDVKDRLFKDSDGKWKIERNIGERVFNGTENWNKEVNNMRVYSTNLVLPADPLITICSHFVRGITNEQKEKSPYFLNAGAGYIELNTETSLIGASAIKQWVANEYAKGTPLTFQYQLATPTYEMLSQELQTKLDNIPTFPENNYVYTVTNDNLQPILHVDYKKLSWLKSRLLLNSLKIYSRNLTDAEMIQNYKVEKERFGM